MIEEESKYYQKNRKKYTNDEYKYWCYLLNWLAYYNSTYSMSIITLLILVQTKIEKLYKVNIILKGYVQKSKSI